MSILIKIIRPNISTGWGMAIGSNGKINEVDAGSPAESAGILAGAAICKIDGEYVKGDMVKLMTAVRARGQSTTMTLELETSDAQNTFFRAARLDSAVFEPEPGNEEANTYILQRADPADPWGMLVADDGTVKQVIDNSPSYVAGVPVGARITHTNGRKTTTGAEFVKELRAVPPTRNMLVRITAIAPTSSADTVNKTYNLTRGAHKPSWGVGFTNTGVVTEVVKQGPADIAGVIQGIRIVNVAGRAAEK